MPRGAPIGWKTNPQSDRITEKLIPQKIMRTYSVFCSKSGHEPKRIVVVLA